ncbi:MAG: HdeD family acid-resistance protein [Anaerolineae bacterium]|nr:HdeD family acid-resistance protein [Anaerolineae bacterium]
MLGVMSKNWWMVALRGVAAIIFGILIILFPNLAIGTFVFVFAAYALVDGIFTIINAVQNRNQSRWWVYLLEGIIGVIAGIVVFANPLFSAITLPLFVLYIVAFWAIFTGVSEIVAAFQLRKEIEGEFWLGLSGLLSLVFGILLLVNPGEGILTLLFIVAAYAIIFGAMLIMLAFRLRGLRA